MAVGQAFSNLLHQRIESYIRDFLLVTPSLYNWFKANNLVRNIDLGQDSVTYFNENQPDEAQMASSIHDANIITPEYTETRIGLLYLAGRVRISLQDAHKFKANQFIGGNLTQRTINSALRVMLNQVDQFCAWGDDMRNPVKAFDPFSNKGEFTGIFNSGTEMGGGIDEGNDMQDAGDYLATVARMRTAMINAGHKLSKYPIFSDTETELFSQLENQFYINVGVTEYRRIRELDYIQDWMISPNFLDLSAVDYRMVMVAPRQRVRKGRTGIRPNLELIQAYPFHVHPEYSGGTNNGYFEYLLIWSGAVIVYYDTAIQHTGTLVLT